MRIRSALLIPPTTGYFLRKILRESWNRDKSFAISGPPVWRLPGVHLYLCGGRQRVGGSECRDLRYAERSPETIIHGTLFRRKRRLTKALMDEYIKRERRVELFYENSRIWTARLYLEARVRQRSLRGNMPGRGRAIPTIRVLRHTGLTPKLSG